MDSGWTASSLDPSAASGLKTLKEMGVTVDDPILSHLPTESVVVMDKLTLGGAQFMNQPIERRKMQMDYIQVLYSGVLGFDFLLRNFALLDCAGRRLYVRGEKPSDDTSKALAETLHRSGFTNVALRGDYRFMVTALVNGQAAELLVDSGAALSVIDESERKRLSLETLKEQHTGSLIPQEVGQSAHGDNAKIIGPGKIGGHRLRAVKLKTFQIGGVDWNNLLFVLADLSAWGISNSDGNKISGVLGPDCLGPQGALIDFSSRTLWFSPPKKPSR